MKKVMVFLLAVLAMVSMFAGCAKPAEDPKSSPSVPALTDFATSEAQQHEVILPWPWEEGESADNRYYKRTTDINGNAVYAVMQASNNQVAYLPMGSTVVYTGQYETSYYEKFTITYKEGNQDREMVQYQLYVGTGNVDPNKVETMVPTESADVTGAETDTPESSEAPEETDPQEEDGDTDTAETPESDSTGA